MANRDTYRKRRPVSIVDPIPFIYEGETVRFQRDDRIWYLPDDYTLLSSINIGVHSNLGSYRNTDGPKGGMSTDKWGWQNNIRGRIGEGCWAAHRNIKWDGDLGNYKAGDVGDFYEVRSKPLSEAHFACLQGYRWDKEKGDKFDKPFILALVGVEDVFFMGWLWGREVLQEQYFADHSNRNNPYYAIPQHELRSIFDVPELPPELWKRYKIRDEDH